MRRRRRPHRPALLPGGGGGRLHQEEARAAPQLGQRLGAAAAGGHGCRPTAMGARAAGPGGRQGLRRRQRCWRAGRGRESRAGPVPHRGPQGHQKADGAAEPVADGAGRRHVVWVRGPAPRQQGAQAEHARARAAGRRRARAAAAGAAPAAVPQVQDVEGPRGQAVPQDAPGWQWWRQLA